MIEVMVIRKTDNIDHKRNLKYDRGKIMYMDEELRKKLKKEGLLMRDPRAKERRKFGLKKARKAAQWAKR